MMKLFDSHCHLQDARIFSQAPQVIATALDSGVLRFAVNGVSENDWHLVKQLSDCHPCVIPCFGLHPWHLAERTPFWLSNLKLLFEANPSAAVGEIGLDKGSRGRKIDFGDQVDVFQQQLTLAKELNRPVSIHCVRAFGDLLSVMQRIGPFPAGVLLHSYLGSAEMVSEFNKLGAYFSFSGYLMSMKAQKAKKMLNMIPTDKLLLETDAPDALPISCSQRHASTEEPQNHVVKNMPENIASSVCFPGTSTDILTLTNERLNHPANIHEVLNYVASLLEVRKEEVAERSYENALRFFSYQGSKLQLHN